MTLRRVSIRAFALVVLCTATVSARPQARQLLK